MAHVCSTYEAHCYSPRRGYSRTLLLLAIAGSLIACGDVAVESTAATPSGGLGASAADTTPPSTPAGLTATAAGSTGANLSWSASTDNIAVTGYTVLRDGTPIATIAATNHGDTGLTAGTSYTYTVFAVDAAGNASAQTAPVTATTAAAPPPDTTSPSAPTNLVATPGTNAINLTWGASTDNVAVTGYIVRRNSTPVATSAATNHVDTGLTVSTTYSYTVSAVDAAGNESAQTAPVTATTAAAPPGGLDFQTRCAQPGVIKCVGFDAAADIAGGFGANSGIFSGATTPMLDASVKASGASSLKFTIPSQSGADTSGSYFTNFSTDLLTQFGANSEFYVQWRQRFSPEFLNTVYAGVNSPEANGWKQIIIGSGDKPGGVIYFSCTALETVVQNTYQRGFPQMYNSCTGSSSHGSFASFEEPFGNFDFKLQNARPSPYCLYSASNAGTQFPPTGNCFGYFPNEWMTFQIKIKTGPRVNDEWTNSFVTLWMARENQSSEFVINFPWNLTAGDPALDQKFGKVWFLPYHTNKNPAQSHPVGFTWYDELIISTTPIADPAP